MAAATPSVVIAAGGTGGHMFPALAVAEAIGRRGATVTLVTDTRGARFVPAATGCRVISAGSPFGELASRLRGMALLLRGALQSLGLVRSLSPAAAALFGGYASAPVGVAAAMRGVPLLVHEQNAVFGRANRLVARFARIVALSFDETRALPGADRATRLVTGNPVRPGFAVTPASSSAVTRGDRFHVLVLGGSQGARVFSDVLPAAIARLAPTVRDRLAIAQQCRPEDLDRVRGAYAAVPFHAELATFFDDVPARMAASDLLIARSGASTVAEILALARPSILVPYPFAADDHQTANAAALAGAGAALLLPQPELTPDRLAAELAALLAEPSRLSAMTAAAANLARPDAAERLADAVLSLAKGPLA
jgi:UDP-N-acetylglucosamine--N-acetylmuramyl-(pentapeptide) pyrophosphoryl-undecaprenol N-acetylglucosamine transferase